MQNNTTFPTLDFSFFIFLEATAQQARMHNEQQFRSVICSLQFWQERTKWLNELMR
jgi:hypothetical protein